MRVKLNPLWHSSNKGISTKEQKKNQQEKVFEKLSKTLHKHFPLLYSLLRHQRHLGSSGKILLFFILPLSITFFFAGLYTEIQNQFNSSLRCHSEKGFFSLVHSPAMLTPFPYFPYTFFWDAH